MAVYAYRAVTATRQPASGQVAADSPRAARDQLRSQGLIVESLVPTASKSEHSRWTWRWTPSRVRQVEVIRELSTLLGVGIPLVESLDILLRQHRGAWRATLLQLRDRVAGGASLSEAMGAQPEYFDRLCRQMVEVGEHSGTLDQVLAQLADFRERALELRDRVLTALLYPGFVLVAAIGVSLFLMTVVVPMLLENLVESGRPLPWPTRVLKSLSDTLVSGWPWLSALLVVGSTGAVWLGRQPQVRRQIDRRVLGLPLLGRMVLQQAIARIALIVGVLMRSGVEFVQSLDIAAESVRNSAIRGALDDCQQAVQSGRDIGEALAQSSLFPPLVVQVFAVGQQTGRLEEMLERLAADYDRQVATTSTRLATVLEPVLIVLVSTFVGFILFATILPILEAGRVL
jgi:type II secretory pathway component PulF